MDSEDMEEIVYVFKRYVETGAIESCSAYLEELQATGQHIAWDYIFQKVYLHACLKKQKPIVDWMHGLYETMNDMEKIAIRHVFSYGQYLISK